MIHRRDFLSASIAAASAGLGAAGSARSCSAPLVLRRGGDGPGYASPAEAIKGPRETLLYVLALYEGTGIAKPDYLAVVDADPKSPTYSRIVHRLEMPNVGDELHHFGWNACSSCHGDSSRERKFLIAPGLKSSRIHIIDVSDARKPKMHKVIEPETIKAKANLSAPHTSHCLPDGHVMISMLGDGAGDGPGGFLLLDPSFEIAGHWEKNAKGMAFNYDFWYQPHHNVMVSSEWAAPKTYGGGFNPKDVAAGKYGDKIHFWDWENRKIAQSIALGDQGRIPLEVRFFHDPRSVNGYVGAALSSVMWRFHRDGDDKPWKAEKAIEVEMAKAVDGSMIPGLITDLLISMDDRFLYFSNWLHGDIRQYDISNPAKPKLTGQVWTGGLLGKAPAIGGETLSGGPQMLQLSLDGKRLFVTNSLLSAWDNQFYPDIAKQGSRLLQIDCDTEKGGLKINENFFVDFGKEPYGPARAHEMRYPGGDCTSDIFT